MEEPVRCLRMIYKMVDFVNQLTRIATPLAEILIFVEEVESRLRQVKWKCLEAKRENGADGTSEITCDWEFPPSWVSKL